MFVLIYQLLVACSGIPSGCTLLLGEPECEDYTGGNDLYKAQE